MKRLLLFFAALLLSLAWAIELVFLDVGQADAVLIRSPSGQVVLYDAGEREANVLGLLQALGVDRLDLVIASHAHSDHIGGMADVIRHYRPRFYMDNGLPHPTFTYERTLEAALEVGAQLLEPTARRITLGEVALRIVPPPGIEAWGQNDNSVGILIEYGDFRSFLPGDAEPRQWWWLERHPELIVPVQVHRASYHGSRNGDIAEALALLAPEIVVISVGADNRYGHPHAEAIALYTAVGAEIYRTDRHGHVTVNAERDGTYRISTQREVSLVQLGHPTPAPALAGECIDINRADIEALRRIIHIDIERAQQIVTLRLQRPFTSVDQLTRLPGIGEARLRDIKAQGLACVP